MKGYQPCCRFRKVDVGKFVCAAKRLEAAYILCLDIKLEEMWNQGGCGVKSEHSSAMNFWNGLCLRGWKDRPTATAGFRPLTLPFVFADSNSIRSKRNTAKTLLCIHGRRHPLDVAHCTTKVPILGCRYI
jgi:hypothetical protein